MMRNRIGWGVTCVVVFLASPVWGQVQRWQQPNGSVESRVLSCGNPAPLNRIAMDDFTFQQTTVIRWIRWWGIVLDPAQLAAGRYYYVAIYGSGNGPCAGNCNPVQLLASWCLNPSKTNVGTDCLDRRVYRFSAALAPNFIALGGTKYWLQISEIDDVSARPGVEDFRWSGYRPIVNCPAQQRDGGGGVFCNIPDDCVPAVATDLSYELRSNCLGGVIILPPIILPPHAFLLEIRSAAAPLGPPIAVECVQPDDGGEYFLDHNLPDGNYVGTLVGMAAPRPKATTMIQNGAGTLSFFDVFVGDLNNNGSADGADTQVFVDGLLMGP